MWALRLLETEHKLVRRLADQLLPSFTAKLCPGGRWTHAVCFMTNGGGMLEEDKAQQLSTWLDVPVKASQASKSVHLGNGEHGNGIEQWAGWAGCGVKLRQDKGIAAVHLAGCAGEAIAGQ